MKKIFLIVAIVVLGTACSDDFLDRYPKGRWHHGNYTPDNELDPKILTEAKLAQVYSTLREYAFFFRWFWNAKLHHSGCRKRQYSQRWNGDCAI